MNDLVSKESRTGATLTVVGEEIPFGAYQAIYHKLTKKTEKDRKFYGGAYSIDFGDIDNINARLNQSIKQYQVKAARSEVTHAIRGGSTRYHSSFEKFKLLGNTNSKCTQRISYEFDFLVILPPEISEASEIAQRFKLTLIFDQDLSDESEEPFFYSRLPDINNIELSIEYSDYSVYQHLRAVVDEWVEGLPKREPAGFLKIARGAEKHVRPIISTAIPFFACWSALRYFSKAPQITPAGAAQVIVIILALSLSGVWLVDYLYQLGNKALTKLHPVTYLCFTTGDSVRKAGIESSKNRRIAFSIVAFTSVIVTFVVNIFSNYFYDFLT